MVISQSLVCDISTLARFKEWAQAISTAFSTFGWVQTADTGQVNWTTIASVPASGSPVYEIWRMGDVLHLTAPFYLKIEYGTNTGNSSPGVWVTIGTGSNGAGTLSNIVTRQAIFNTGLVVGGATQYTCKFAGGTNWFTMAMWYDYSPNTMTFGVERSKDANGADTDEFATIWGFGRNNFCFQASLLKNGTTPGVETRILDSFLTTRPSSVFNNFIGVAPVYPFVGFAARPLTTIVTLKSADFTVNNQFTADLFGQSRNFIALTNNVTSSNTFGAMIAMRYD